MKLALGINGSDIIGFTSETCTNKHGEGINNKL
jgi:hypothetical protein